MSKIYIGQKVYNDELGEGIISKISKFDTSEYMYIDFNKKKGVQFRVDSNSIHLVPSEKFLRRYYSLSKIDSNEVQKMEKNFFIQVEQNVDRKLKLLQDEIADSRLGYAVTKEINDYEIQINYSTLITEEKNLLKILNQPYFGKIGYFENEIYDHFYLGEVADEDNEIVSWADERSIMYYQHELFIDNEKENKKLQLKREFDISNATYFGYEDVVDLLNKEPKKGELSEKNKAMITDPRLLKVLENRRQSEEINHIITTIRANQYEMITFDRHKNVLVLGCAGSGKTMILLHRITFLTIRFRGDFALRNCFIISPSKMLNTQLKILSDKLDISQSNLFSTDEFYTSVLRDSYETCQSFLYETTNNIVENTPNDLQEKIYSIDFLNQYVNEINELLNSKGVLKEKFQNELTKYLCHKFNVNEKTILLVKETFDTLIDMMKKTTFPSLVSFMEAYQLNKEKNDDFYHMLTIISTDLKNIFDINLHKMFYDFFGKALATVKNDRNGCESLSEKKYKLFKLFIYKKISNDDKPDYLVYDEFAKIVQHKSRNMRFREYFRYYKSATELNNKLEDVATLIDSFLVKIDNFVLSLRENENILCTLMNLNCGDINNLINEFLALKEHLSIISLRIKDFSVSLVRFNEDLYQILRPFEDNYFQIALINVIEFDKIITSLFEYINLQLPYLKMEYLQILELINFIFTFSFEKFFSEYRKIYADVNEMLKLFIYNGNDSSKKYQFYDKYKENFCKDEAIISALEYVRFLRETKIEGKKLEKLIIEHQELFFDELFQEYINVRNGIINESKFISIINHIIVKEIKNDLKINTHKCYNFEGFVQCYILSRFNLIKTYEHKEVYIDEVQDYTNLEIDLFTNIFKKSKFNFYGDLSQTIHNKKTLNLSHGIFKDIKTFKINENYRNAFEITKVVNEELDMEMFPIGLNGKVEYLNEYELNFIPGMILITKENITLSQLGEQVNIIGQDSNQINKEKINVFSVQSVKGLEFETVYVYVKNMSKNERYISYTRALSNLIIVT